MKKVLFLAAAALLSLPFAVNAQLVITPNNNATTLAQTLVGGGVTISGATFTGAATQGGTFTGGSSVGLGFNSGLILTSGNVADIDQAGSAFASVPNATPGDANLNTLLGGNLTQDAAVLEFDLVPQGNTLNFRYVFGSEEYPEYVCSDYNDIFAFLISGANPGGGNYTNSNIALIPSSSLSVTINTVNPGVSGANGAPANCQSLAYSSLYIDNDASTLQPVYDGYTIVLNATVGVVPCSTYHLKLAIADVFDGAFDSGVFVEAQSLVTASANVTASYDAGFTSAFEGCVGGYFTITVPNLATSSTAISYTVSGTGTNGVDYPNLNGTAFVNPGTSSALVYVDPLTDNIVEGLETVTITINDPCTGLPLSSATINMNDKPVDTAYASKNVACLGEQIQLTATGGGTYSWSPPGAVSNPNIANPTAVINSNTIFDVQIIFGTCTTSREVFVAADSLSVSIQSVANGTLCPGTADTLVAIDNQGYSPFTYSWTSNPPGQVTNPTSNVIYTAPTQTTIYTVVITDATGCQATATYTLNVATNLQISLGPDVNVCPEDTPHIISVPGGPYTTYSWSTGATTPTISVYTTGDYWVTTTFNTCTYTSDTVQITILSPVDPALADASFCANEDVTLNAAQGLTNIVWNTSATTPSITVNTPGTYWYTADDANGCEVFSDTATVTDIAIPAVNLDATPDTICPGLPSVITSGTATGLTYNWSNGPTTQDITVTAGGTYYFTVSDGTCSNYDTITVYEFQNPNALVAADTTVCNGEAVTFELVNGPFVTYAWSNGTNGVDSITVTQPGTYVLSVTDVNGCVWTSNTVTLSNFPTPVPTITDTGGCTGETIVLWAENGLVNIQWNNQATSQTISVTADGTFYYTAEDVNGCPVASDTVDVTFLPAPVVNATTSDDTICPGASAVISANATGTSLTYLWSPNGETSDTIIVTQAGVYTVVISNGFCPSYDTVEIFMYQFPPVTVGPDQTICVEDTIVLTASGGPYVSYTWSNGVTSATDTVNAPGNYSVVVDNGTCILVSDTMTLNYFPGANPTLLDSTLCLGGTVVLSVPTDYSDIVWSNGAQTNSISVTTSGNYSFTGTTPDGCDAASDTATINFVTPPTVSIDAAPDTICAGGSSVLTATSNATGFNWSAGGSTSSITVTSAGTYYLTVSDGSCQNFDTITVYQYTHAPVLLRNDTIVCPGASVTLSPSGSPYVTYTWSNGLTTSTITVTTPGNYSVTVNDGNCNYVSDTFTLSNFQIATPVAHSDTNVCAGQPVTLFGDPDYSNYVWSNGAGTGISVTVTTAGSYTYTANDGLGCSVTSTAAVVTHRPYPTPNITATPPAICVGQGSTILNAGSEANVSYVWQPGQAQTPTITVTQPGTYTVQATLNNCTVADTLTVNAADTPVLTLTSQTSCCQQVVLDPAPGQGYTFVWNDGSTDSTYTVSNTGDTTETYSVTATNSAGCTSSAQVTVLIKCIDASASANPDTVFVGDSTQLTVTTGYQGGFNYSWTPAETVTNPNGQTTGVVPADETTYTVVVTDTVDGCVDTASVIVYVQFGEIIMPNAFTPNGDGKNDDFYPVILSERQEVIEFRIYDRWGAMVHNSTDPWNGDFSGKGQPAGTFTYYIIVRIPDPKVEGGTRDQKVQGSLTLLR